MLNKVVLLLATLALFSAENASAKFRLGLSYGELKSASSAYDLSPDAFTVSISSEISEVLDWSARIGASSSEDSATINGFRTTGDVEYFYGAYIIGKIPTQVSIKPYGIVGITEAKAEASYTEIGLFFEDKGSDFSFGFGIDYQINAELSVNLEYMSYIKKTDYELETTSLGFKWTF